MRKVSKFFLLVTLTQTLSSANEYVVIANKNMKNLSPTQIRAIYLKKLSYVNNLKLLPINLNPQSSIREAFKKNILQMSLRKLNKYWIKQHYLGHRPPLSMKSQKSVKAFVKKIDGAIGYIESINVDKDVKILYKWSDK